MIFDAHTDVLFDIINGNHSFEYHLSEMKEYKGAVLNYYFKGNESYNSFLFVLLKIKEFYHANNDLLKKRNFVLGIEGLGPLKNITDIDLVYEAGVRCVTLTWNDANKIATGTYTNKRRGLTKFGQQILDKIKSKSMLLDLSHLNRKSFWQVIKYYNGPMLVSHSNVDSLKHNERNLTDTQLKVIKDKGIIVGINTFHKFIKCENGIQGLIDIIYYLIKMIGIDYICLGLDFDYYLSNVTKTDSINGLQYPSDINSFKKLLVDRGFKEKDIEKLFYKNILNFFKSSLIL